MCSVRGLRASVARAARFMVFSICSTQWMAEVGKSSISLLGLMDYTAVLGTMTTGPLAVSCFTAWRASLALVEGEDLDLGLDADFAGELEEVACVLAGHVGDAADLALAPEERVVVECGHLVEVDGVDGDDAAFAKAGERADDDGSAGSEGDGAVELDGRLVVFGADPGRAER